MLVAPFTVATTGTPTICTSSMSHEDEELPGIVDVNVCRDRNPYPSPVNPEPESLTAWKKRENVAFIQSSPLGGTVYDIYVAFERPGNDMPTDRDVQGYIYIVGPQGEGVRTIVGMGLSIDIVIPDAPVPTRYRESSLPSE